LARLCQLAAQLPDGCRLRLDANRAWADPDCERWLAALRNLPIESLEEPLADPTPARLARLQASTPIPLALDESLVAFGLEAVLADPPVRRLVLKPMVHGGLLPCLDAARSAPGLEWVVTTTIDSAAGTWAAAQLAAAIGSPLAQGLATAEWLARDLGPPPLVRAGWLQLPEEPGLGFHRSGGEQ
jgi:L-alanine-DL-glutamate epimerase-like enolase superfamily enzyme